MKPQYSMVIQWSNEDQAYLVHLPDFPQQQFVTHGDTYEAAARHSQEAIESLIAWHQADNYPLPIPKIRTAA
jgi:antitoxin HicB